MRCSMVVVGEEEDSVKTGLFNVISKEWETRNLFSYT